MHNVRNVLNKRKTCFLYGRVSSDEQALYGDSLRAQMDELRKWAKQNNFEILDEYVYDGFSARELKRPWNAADCGCQLSVKYVLNETLLILNFYNLICSWRRYRVG